jgi:hypothetical protein
MTQSICPCPDSRRHRQAWRYRNMVVTLQLNSGNTIVLDLLLNSAFLGTDEDGLPSPMLLDGDGTVPTKAGRTTLKMLRRKSKMPFVNQELKMQNAIVLQKLMLRTQVVTKKITKRHYFK